MKKIGLLFPGGGTQYVGMGKLLWKKYQIVKDLFQEASDVLNMDMTGLCFDSSLEKLSLMENSQPATLLTSVAAYKALTLEYNIVPSIGAGHSLGEYSALTCAGVLSFSDALRLIQRRGELLQRVGTRNNGSMMAVNKIRASVVQELIDTMKLPDAYVSVYNSPLQSVVSGRRESLNKLAEGLKNRGGDAMLLNINTSSHCPLMADAALELRKELEAVPLTDFAWPVVANLTARPYEGCHVIPTILTDHMTQPVLWDETVGYMVGAGTNYWIDMGPQAVLKNLLRFAAPFPQSNLYAFDVQDDALILGIDLQPNIAGFIKNCLAIANATPNYHIEYSHEEFHSGVMIPYARLREIRERIETSSATTTLALEASHTLNQLLKWKKIPLADREDRLKKAAMANHLDSSFFHSIPD